MNTLDTIEYFCLSLSARGRAERTVREYRKRLRALAGFERLELIGPEDLDRLLVGLRERGLARATIGSVVQSLRTFFSWCVGRGYLERSPARELSRPKPEPGVSRVMLQGDIDRMAETARREGDALGLAVVLFLADTGCRAGELRRANLDDLDLAAMEITTTGKTGRRVLDFTQPTAEALGEWLRVRPGTDPAALFTTRCGRLSEWGLYKLLWRLALRTGGVRRWNPQAFRHRVGQGWIDAGANLEIVRVKLGHKEISTTSLFYAHQDRGRMRAASRRFSLVR